jgi:hypothetical protein
VLGAALFLTGQPHPAAAFVAIGIAWFAISFTRFSAKQTITK